MFKTTVLVIGVSEGGTCGVRDHARRLNDALISDSVQLTSVWWERPRGAALWQIMRGLWLWLCDLRRVVATVRPSFVLIHYSVFAYSHKGIPLYAPLAFLALRRRAIDLPIVTFLHEFAYPWGRSGWRGVAWATTQRLALWLVVSRSAALIATTPQRAEWIASRRWLPRRPVAVAPVFSNLPSARPLNIDPRTGARVGLFGYGHEAVPLHTLLDAFSTLRQSTPELRLLLLGAPGADSPAGRQLLNIARQRGLDNSLDFTGVLAAQVLSDALAACDVLLFADLDGPSSRKGTLAASLASGRPVVALDGPNTWPDLVLNEAMVLVRPTAPALAEEVRRLLVDRSEADALGSRGREFAEQFMSVDKAASVVLSVVREVVVT